jgi:hypothetical protein
MSTLRVTTVTNPSGGQPTIDGLAKAWVNFNGTGTVAIRASLNVSSITDNGTGDYTLNFTTALADANYGFNGTCQTVAGNTQGCVLTQYGVTTQAAGSLRVVTLQQNTSGLADPERVCVSIFR